MTRAEAEAAIGRRVRVAGGSYDGAKARITGVTRRLIEVKVEGARCRAIYPLRLSPYRLHLIKEEETP